RGLASAGGDVSFPQGAGRAGLARARRGRRGRAADPEKTGRARARAMKTQGLAVFNSRDLSEIKKRGIPPGEALRQLETLAHPPAPAHLERPCVPGDGITVLPESEADRHLAAADTARLAGRLGAFTPASGAS